MTSKGTWTLTIRSADGEPREYVLKPGKNSIGRSATNDIIINDSSASRQHAEINFDANTNIVTLIDLNSTNGTFVNRNRLEHPYRLGTNDIIRIGTCLLNLNFYRATNTHRPHPRGASGTRPLTRELLVESFDQHAVLMYEVASQLNTVLDIDAALRTLSQLIQQFMGTDKCEIILATEFGKLEAYGIPSSIAQAAIQQKTTIAIPDMDETEQSIRNSDSPHRMRSALCVPIMANQDVIALLYMYKSNPESRPFDQQDVKLAVAISHLASLTIQRVLLLERVREEQKTRYLLQRFLSASEVDYLLQDYLRTGQLPGLQKQKVTVLFADIVDSTRMAQEMGVQKFGKSLGQFYKAITDIVFEHGGLVNKYLGDGVMAVFGMTRNENIPEVQAVRAGLKMLKSVEKGLYCEVAPFRIGVGVNTGSVMAGYVGTKEHVELTVLGDTVNVASRLEELAKPGKLLIGPATRAALSGEFDSIRIGETSIRGRSTPIQVYQVLTQTDKLAMQA